jgi:hypothetical protein
MILTQKNKLYLSNDDKFIVDKLSYHSARLYNSCVYNIRQYYFNNNSFLSFKEQYNQIKSDGDLSPTDIRGVINHLVRINPTKSHSFS